jgi:hypothetical protein
MTQQTSAMAADQGAGVGTRRKRTQRVEFFNTSDTIMPWAGTCAVVKPYYPKRNNGRPPMGLDHILRIQFAPSGSLCCEEALYDSASLRRCVGIAAARAAVSLVRRAGERGHPVGPLGVLKNRDRLLEHEVAESFFTEVTSLAEKRGRPSRAHFSADGH